MARWGVAVSGIAQLNRALRATAVEAHNFRPALTAAVDQVMRPSIATNFEVGGRPPWEPLADATIERKGDDTPLIDSGQGAASAGARARWKIDRDQAAYQGDSFPERTWYMRLQQGGDADWDVTFPGRPWAVIQPEDVDRMRAVFGRWLDVKVIPRYGRG
jgi:phage gpG-like protein